MDGIRREEKAELGKSKNFKYALSIFLQLLPLPTSQEHYRKSHSKLTTSVQVITTTSCSLIHFLRLFSSITLRFFVCLFLGLQVEHMEVPRLGVESELQLLA